MADQRRMPPDDDPDSTRAYQPAPEEPVEPSASEDATAMLPPAAGDRWSGRAGVRPGQPPEVMAPNAAPAEEYADQAGGPWWAPALVGVIALVLLAVLGFGIWLILNALDRSAGPPPLPSPSGSTASATASPSPAPTTAGSPTPSPAPVVAVPPVVGLPLADARNALDRVGLKSQVVERPDGNARPNTVVAVVPAPGTEVTVGSTVTLHVAVAPRPTGQQTTAAPTATTTGR